MRHKHSGRNRSPSRSLFVRILRSPRLEIALGLFMFVIGFIEVMEDAFLVAFPSPDIHHVIILLGGITAFRGLIDVFEGLEQIVDGETEIKSHGTAGDAAPLGGDTLDRRA